MPIQHRQSSNGPNSPRNGASGQHPPHGVDLDDPWASVVGGIDDDDEPEITTSRARLGRTQQQTGQQPGQWKRVTPRGPVTAQGVVAGSPAGQTAQQRQIGSLRRTLVAAVTAAVIVGTGIGGVLVYTMTRQPSVTTPAPVEAPPPELGRPAPMGWSPAYAWSDRTAGSVAHVAVGLGHVAYRDGDTLIVRDAETGAVRWKADLSGVSAQAKPMIGAATDRATVVIADGTNLMVWPLVGAEVNPQPALLAVPPSAKVSVGGGGFLVYAGNQVWNVTADYRLGPVTLPEKNVPFGVAPNGDLYAAPPAGGWSRILPGQDPVPIRPSAIPPGTVGEVFPAWLSNGYLVAWGASADPGRRTVGVYEAATGELIMSAEVTAEVVRSGIPFTVAADRSLGSAGPVLLNFTTRTATVVDGWSSIAVDSRNVYGTVNGEKRTWQGSGMSVAVDPKSAVPWGTSPKGLAVVVDRGADGKPVIGALKPQ